VHRGSRCATPTCVRSAPGVVASAWSGGGIPVGAVRRGAAAGVLAVVGAAGAPSSPSWDPNLGFSFTSRVWYSPNLARSVPRAVSSIIPAQEKNSQSLLLPCCYCSTTAAAAYSASATATTTAAAAAAAAFAIAAAATAAAAFSGTAAAGFVQLLLNLSSLYQHLTPLQTAQAAHLRKWNTGHSMAPMTWQSA